ncbi:hypothetical protein AAFF_G00396870 [Aldrovandia affinis]|uniref:Uncharacterized protein n=1 Tax=Aldrovandia affinis TaxID=143900 RepID=A0AAD7WLC3_9TELE|nr:hypothetical protein AAFF_G00396870 [Aldrovandia affinis]
MSIEITLKERGSASCSQSGRLLSTVACQCIGGTCDRPLATSQAQAARRQAAETNRCDYGSWRLAGALIVKETGMGPDSTSAGPRSGSSGGGGMAGGGEEPDLPALRTGAIRHSLAKTPHCHNPL